MRTTNPLRLPILPAVLAVMSARNALAQGVPSEAVSIPTPTEEESESAANGATTGEAEAGNNPTRDTAPAAPEGETARADEGGELPSDAADAATSQADTEDTAMNIGPIEVVVAAHRSRSMGLPGSVDVIGEEEISKEVTTNTLDVMRKIPGFAYQDYGNGGVPNGFMLRGFSSNHGSDTLVVVDGIPINDNFWQEDGAPDLNQLTTEEIERVEVVKGPLDARYGNWARSGIIQIHTRQTGDFARARVTGGSYGFKKAYVSFGKEHFQGRFNQVYSAEIFQTDGWRENSEQQRQNAYGKWFYNPTQDLRLGMMAHVYKADWSTGAYITEEQWRQNPRQAFPGSANDGGYKSLGELSLHANWEISARSALQARTWYRSSNASRYADWTYEGVGQTESHANEHVTGAVASVDTEWLLPLDQRLRVEAGADFRNFDSAVENWNTSARVRDAVNSDNWYRFQNGGLYLKARQDVTKRARVFAGVRQDFFWGRTKDHLADTESTMKNYQVTTYKGGLVVNPLPRLSVYGNIGTTFRLPHAAAKYQDDPPDVTGLLFWETGIRSSPLDWLTLRYAVFQSDEKLTREVQGEYLDDGRARRTGQEVEASLDPWDWVELFSALTVHDARYDGGENDGNRVPVVPRYIYKLGVAVEAPWHTGVRAQFNDVGEWSTDPQNQHSYEGYQVVDLGMYQVLSQDWTVAFDLKNLLDSTYSEYVGFWSDSNQYMSANPRTVFLSLRYAAQQERP